MESTPVRSYTWLPKSLLLVGVLATIVSVVASTGTSDFATSSNTMSLFGNIVNSDTSFTISNNRVAVAGSSDAGSATATSAQEITAPIPILRTNAVSSGNFVYKVSLVEASALSSGTWTIQILKDGVQVGNTITITQATPISGATEGADIIADLGTSLPTSNTFEIKITKTA